MDHTFPIYNLDKLKEKARLRCVSMGVVPTALVIYKMIGTMRGEELRAHGRSEEVDAQACVDVECVEHVE